MRKRLYIIRGIPGSGKSTYAKKIMTNALSEGKSVGHWENDMFFYDHDGNYKWNEKLIFIAMKWCFNKVKKSLKTNDITIVSNTFVTINDFIHYVELGKEMNATVSVIRCENNFGSIHNVPQEKIDNMIEGFQDYEGETIYKCK